MLSLCESIDQAIHIFVDKPARPILLTNAFASIDKHAIHQQMNTVEGVETMPTPSIKAQFDIVLATLQDDAAPTQTQTQPHTPSTQRQAPAQTQQRGVQQQHAMTDTAGSHSAHQQVHGRY